VRCEARRGPGDTVSVEIEGIGALRNPVKKENA